ncbi:MAG: hypothetical protein U0T83_10105, partial [Bacteriovoracaceae bacterium]
MKAYKLSAVILLLMMSIAAALAYEPSGCGSSLKDGFFPDNQVISKAATALNSNISRDRFDTLLNNLEKSYQAIFKNKQKRLIIKKDWGCDKNNAYATRGQLREEGTVDLDESIVIVNGGLARYPLMTEDALLLVVCHEIGHHIGGSPKKMRGNSQLVDWSAAEGQADYFATTKCLKKIFAEPEFRLPKSLETNNDVEKICGTDMICNRIVNASLISAKIYASISSTRASVDLFNTDRSEAYKTILTHPKPQCRLDTMVAGTLCPVDHNIGFDENDANLGACLKTALDINEKNGARPSC